jgi:DNA-binding transcriptional LysR family regulator
MSSEATPLPNLQALALFVAVVDEGSLGAGARRLEIHQPNASRLIARLEAEAGAPLLDRHPRGSRPTPAGLVYAAHARELLDAAQHFTDWLRTTRDAGAPELHVGASTTIAEHLVPLWLTDLRRTAPATRVLLEVENSTRVIEDVRSGRLRLGFIETPHVPRDIHSRVVAQDELVLVIAPHHPWADRSAPVGAAELAATPLVVREGGSGTRDALAVVLGDLPQAPPALELGSNAAVRIAVASGAGPAVLSALAVRAQLESGELLRVPLDGVGATDVSATDVSATDVGATDARTAGAKGVGLRREFTAVWTGPRRLTGAAADLVAIAEGTAGGTAV